MSSASHPEHDRTSCSDEHPINTDAEGSTGCARCTALDLERGYAAIELLRAMRSDLSIKRTWARDIEAFLKENHLA